MYCHICNKILVGQYYYDAWGHKICASHFNNDVVNCSSCFSFTKKSNVLVDGRILCGLCSSIIVKSNDNTDVFKNTIIETLSKVGFIISESNKINIKIVSAQELSSLNKSTLNTQLKGYTLYKYTTSTNFTNKQKKQNSFQIYILSNLTRIEFLGVLAHEFLHVWLYQNNIKLKQDKFIEGLCNMGSYLVYDLYKKKNVNNPPFDKLSNIYLQQLHNDPDLIYGDGFREVYKNYEKIGWSGLIKKVRNN